VGTPFPVDRCVAGRALRKLELDTVFFQLTLLGLPQQFALFVTQSLIDTEAQAVGEDLVAANHSPPLNGAQGPIASEFLALTDLPTNVGSSPDFLTRPSRHCESSGSHGHRHVSTGSAE